MWGWKNSTILVIFGFFIACITAVPSCRHGYSFPRDFTFNQPSNESAPAIITQSEPYDELIHGELIPRIKVTVTEKPGRGNFNITLFAIPQNGSDGEIKPINATADCDRRITETMDLHQHQNTCFMHQGHEKPELIFDYIFSGCYYVLMTNEKHISWQSEPQFHKTAYIYRNTKILNGTGEYVPGNIETPPMLSVSITIPMPCIEVTAKLYELNGTWAANDNKTVEDAILRNERKSSHECAFRQDGPVNSEYCSRLQNKGLELDVISGKRVKIAWENLQRGGCVYYLRFIGDSYNCRFSNRANSNNAHLTTWNPVIRDILIPIDPKHPPAEASDSLQRTVDYLMVTFGIILGITLAGLLAHFMRKYYSIEKKIEIKEGIESALVTTDPVFDEAKSKQVLLIYAKGSDAFMKTMSTFRHYLMQKCHCKVRDVHSRDEFQEVANLTAHDWFRKLLVDGSKVVWVDTPKLRSYFNDQQMQDASTNFRDAAIPFAIKLATNLFLNPNTQYLDHFVVRVEGFEVTNGHDDDPLRVVTPHTRYDIPLRLDLLCEDITKALKSPNDGQKAVV